MKKTIFIFTLILWSFISNAQVYSSFNNLSLERVYVHQNATLLFVGEYLYYKVYSLEVENNKPSKASKIAYVELIGKNNTVVFKQKIRLENSVGQGEFFIPTTVPSGNYKLLAYTQWMQNNTSFQYFESELNIINPYLGDQSEVVISNTPNEVPSVSENETTPTRIYKHRKFQLLSDKETYGKREKVTLQFVNAKGEIGYGNYSISVRKIDLINRVDSYSATSFYADNATQKIIRKIQTKNYIPEEKGELISGKIVRKDNGLPVQDKSVTISIPGESFFFKIDKTNRKGEFNLFLNEDYDGDSALVQIVGNDRNEFNLTIDEPISIDYNKVKFNKFSITPNDKDFILNRSVNNQIENSYFSVKPDSILSFSAKKYFYNSEKSKVYILEEYQKFPTLNEVFIEVIDPVYKKRIDGEISFYIKHRNDYVDDGAPPLVIMDGIMVQDYKALLAYNASKVDKVIILSDRVYFGTEVFTGVIAIETKEGVFKDDINKNEVASIGLFKPLSIKKYYHQEYDVENIKETSRIPDYRNQLLWLPNIELSATSMDFSFYTSDVSGTYEVILEGFSQIGEAISLRKKIKVK